MIKLLHICGKIMYSEIDVFICLDQIAPVSIAANSGAQSQILPRETGSGICPGWVLLAFQTARYMGLLFMDGKVQAGGTEGKLVVFTWALTYYGTGTRATCGSDVSHVSKAV